MTVSKRQPVSSEPTDTQTLSIETVDVIVVDDDTDASETLRQLLLLDGYTVWTAAGGAEALALIGREQLVCVLLDLNMPEMRGAELARHIRAQFGTALPLIAISGTNDPDIIDDALRAGIDHVLSKPVDWKRLRVMLPPVDSGTGHPCSVRR